MSVRACLVSIHGTSLFFSSFSSASIRGSTAAGSFRLASAFAAVEPIEPLFRSLAPEGGYIHCGPPGAGHYTKMVHNGIEYGLMQAYAEGFAILREKEEFGFDLHQISEIWQHGSVVRSWLFAVSTPDKAE